MTDPENDDVVAAAESVRRWVDVATWTAIALGLAFTAVNVQTFAAAGAAAWSPGWVVAWLLDPMVSVLLLAVVRAEQVTARWQVPMPWQVPAVKWSAFAATYAMNTWSAWRDAVPSSVVLHSVPPLFVLLAAEVAPALRERLTEAVRVATTTTSAPESVQRVVVPAVDDTPAARAAPEPVEPTAALPSSDDTTAVPDDRVRDLAELLAAGCDVTGPQAAALHGVSDRTGRRLVTAARTYLEQHLTRPGLHLVEARAAGGTA
ncbi:hypothetical protein [Actinomycetospora soli]|uniref:hypothetical protein n=1 Tax=Actinomycetospora soli TaxID=2893887 RepID=UPI001E4742F6|nr:hypothetical protein [Actinomycetospora soli]MCD2191349.1 hypothetical protein [Actinomycetospora soli]